MTLPPATIADILTFSCLILMGQEINQKYAGFYIIGAIIGVLMSISTMIK